MKKIPIVSFFSGGGFLDLGFELENFEVKWANEISTEFSKIYNFGMTSALGKNMHIHSNESISDINIYNLKEGFERKWLTTETIWGVIGGPPCQDFSVGGKQRGQFGELGSLSNTYIETIITLSPSFFIFENVKGLTSNKKNRLYFEELLTKLEANGYSLDYKILNALEYGVPQDRDRIILIGIKQDLVDSSKLPLSWDKYKMFIKPKRDYNWPKTDDFGGEPPKPCGLPEELMVNNYIMNIDDSVSNSTEFFKPKSDKFLSIPEGDTNRKSFKRLHRWRYSPTVAYGNNEVHLHPSEARRLSVREALRLQSVPDNYILPSKISLTSKFKVIGNGVPVKMSQAVARMIFEYLQVEVFNV